MAQETDKIDAGLRSLDHYKTRLPRWRYALRERLLPVIRWETPYIAWLQASLRSPALDSYFAVTANLGTHTFFMIVLPILFWCGYTSLGRGLVHILAAGVFFSGFVKDLLCLPRPLSPPLQRITMSGSAALEYGFPSTHSTNAVSVAVYALLLLSDGSSGVSAFTQVVLSVISHCYAFSIVLGRLYCGMHGYFDVVIGSVLGGVISLLQYVYADAIDHYIQSGSSKEMFLVILIILVAVRIHPEPADDCPCFDDSVAFAGVVLGVEFGNWHFAHSRYASSEPVPATVPFDLVSMGWLVAITRIGLGVVVIFVWREVMKPLLLRSLPPVFRVVEAFGMNLPRKFFKQASEYTKIPFPKKHKYDNVIPSISEIPALLGSLRRRRAVSIGPQSAADAYETLAYREKRRRDSHSVPPASPLAPPLDTYESMMGTGFDSRLASPLPDISGIGPPTADPADAIQLERSEQEMFSRLEKPRVRYDVEVVTKLIVYSGIAWLAVEGNPILFHVVGLGV